MLKSTIDLLNVAEVDHLFVLGESDVIPKGRRSWAVQAAALCEPFCSRTRDQAATLPGPACNPARSHLQPKRPSLQPPQALLCAPICDPSGGAALGAVQLVTEAG